MTRQAFFLASVASARGATGNEQSFALFRLLISFFAAADNNGAFAYVRISLEIPPMFRETEDLQ